MHRENHGHRRITTGSADQLFSGEGEMHALGRATDWSATPLGPVSAWPAGLCTAVRLCLDSFFPMAVWAGPELVLIYNQGYPPVLGRSRHPWAFGRLAREVWGDIWEALGPDLARVMQHGESSYRQRQPFRLCRDDIVREAHFDYAFSPIRERDGRISGALNVFQETTTSLRFERDRMLRMFELSHDLLAVAGTDDRYRRVNPAFTRVLGWSEQEMLDHPGRFFVHPEDRDRTTEEVEHLADGRLTLHFENRYRHKDGAYRWLLWAAAPAPEEGLIYAAGRDITEKKRAEQALRDSEARFRALVTATSDVIFRMSPDWRELRVLRGQASLADTHVPTTDWLERHIPVEDQAHVRAVIDQAIRTGSMVALEHRVLRPDGSEGWLFSRALPLRNGGDEIIEWFGAASDITERRQAEEQLRESSRRKDEFLAMLGHELRNPLAAIHNTTELIGLMAPADGPLREAHGVLARQTGHMSRLIDGLLEVTRIARGKIRLERRTLDAREIAEGVLADHDAQARERGLTLAGDLPTEPVWLWADPVRLSQVLVNLLGNAIKFTEPPGEIHVGLEATEGWAVLWVWDTGVGIRPEILDRLFEPFQQETQELARSQGGLGLGLALARGLVELHEGSIHAHSAGPGEGAQFEIRLPLARAPVESTERDTPDAVEPRRILIVEDNPDAGRTLRDLLAVLGHEASVVDSGPEALAALSGQGVDLVLCDLGLPGMSGYEVARAVRAQTALRDTPLVAVTGYGQPGDRRRSLEAGFDEHLTKPVEVTTLNAVLARLG